MARDAEGATKFVRVRVVGARTDAEARIAARAVAEQPARAVLAQRRRPVLGPGALGARRERRVHRSRAGRHLLQRRHRVPRRHRVRARRGRARRGAWPARDIEIALRPAPRRTARRRCSPPTCRTRTSTRTGGRRDRGRATSTRGSTDARREGAHPRRGAAVHPRVLGQDRRDQVRRPRDGGPRARRPVRDRRRAHAARRHEPGRRARRRPADHRPHAPARQGARVRRRPAGHRRRDRRHRAHGARRQGQPRDRRVGQPARLVRGRAVGRGRRAHPGRPARPAARLRRRRARDRPDDRASGCCARS